MYKLELKGLLLAGLFMTYGCGADNPGNITAVEDSAESTVEELSTSLTSDERNTVILAEVSKNLPTLALGDDDIHNVSDIKKVLVSYGVSADYLEDEETRKQLFTFIVQLYPIFKGGFTDEQKKGLLDSTVLFGAGAISSATGLPSGVILAILQTIVDVGWDRYQQRQIEDPEAQAKKEKASRRRKALEDKVSVVGDGEGDGIVREFIRRFMEEAGIDKEELVGKLREEIESIRTDFEERLKELSEQAMQFIEDKLAELRD